MAPHSREVHIAPPLEIPHSGDPSTVRPSASPRSVVVQEPPRSPEKHHHRSPTGAKKRVGKTRGAAKAQIQTCTLGSNEYTGLVKTSELGKRTLEGAQSKYAWADGTRYEGPFAGSKIQGSGRYTWPDGSVYEGMLQDGLRHGEGKFTRGDGVTKYEGQWHFGRRHGHGRLTYDEVGKSSYVGQWENDKKHGHGLQVWPSGNSYEGEWREGFMCGEGEMRWASGQGLPVVYKGHWEDNLPQGEGAHTWHAPLPKADAPGREHLPSQQSNNSYKGQWSKGVRQGRGTFYYANGAKYTGEWGENMKHGYGKYTNEDGNAFHGHFVRDSLQDSDGSAADLFRVASPADASAASTAAPGQRQPLALNVGAADNPIRRCIDLSDLEPRVEGASTAGMQEPSEPVRNVHNMLLRQLAELREIFARYRVLLPWPEADPFVLTTHQLWLLARDVGLVSLGCPLARLDRVVLCGPRHHQEAGKDEERYELRPLTPRVEKHLSKLEFQEKMQLYVEDSRGGATPSAAVSNTHGNSPSPSPSRASTPPSRRFLGQSATTGSVVGDDDLEEDDDDEVSSRATSILEYTPHVERSHGRKVSRNSAAGGLRRSTSVSEYKMERYASYMSCFSVDNFNDELEAFTPFWRQEGGDDLVDIHLPNTIFHFRHFLEGLVRFAIVCFPKGPGGLEEQLRRLLKECIPLSRSPSSEHILAPLLDPPLRTVLAASQPSLWRLFKALATGPGPYVRPLRESELGRKSLLPEDPSPDLGHFGRFQRTLRRGFAGPYRRSHARARLDVTIRVKDLLQMLRGAGLLLPLSVAVEDFNAAVIPDPVQDPSTLSRGSQSPALEGGDDEVSRSKAEASSDADLHQVRAGVEHAYGAPHEHLGEDADVSATDREVEASIRHSDSDPTPQQGAPPALIRALTENRPAGDIQPRPLIRDSSEPLSISYRKSSQIDSDFGAMTCPVTRFSAFAVIKKESKDPPKEAVHRSEYKIDLMALMEIITEVFSPSSLHTLRWMVRGDDPAVEEYVPLLDFMETELTFFEFERVLLRIAERRHSMSVGAPLLLHRNVELFLTTVLFPSLQESAEAEADEIDSFWLGVDNGGDGCGKEDITAALAPRTLPEDYCDEVADW